MCVSLREGSKSASDSTSAGRIEVVVSAAERILTCDQILSTLVD